jgi:hypothetical protein
MSFDPTMIRRLGDRQPGEVFNGIIYGPSGSGKTHLLGTCGDRTLYINTGDGLATLESPAFQRKIASSNMLTIDATEDFFPDRAEAFDFVCDAIDYCLKERNDEFDYVVIDDCSSLGDFAMNKGLEVSAALDKSKTIERMGKLIKRFRTASPAMQDWGMEMSLMEQFLKGYRDIINGQGKHFVVTAHEDRIFKKALGARMGDDEVLTSIVPAFTGTKKRPDRLPKMFENVWHTEVVGGGDQVAYRVRTAGDEIMMAKSRHLGVFKVVEVNPNLQDMIKRIQNQKRA